MNKLRKLITIQRDELFGPHRNTLFSGAEIARRLERILTACPDDEGPVKRVDDRNVIKTKYDEDSDSYNGFARPHCKECGGRMAILSIIAIKRTGETKASWRCTPCGLGLQQYRSDDGAVRDVWGKTAKERGRG